MPSPRAPGGRSGKIDPGASIGSGFLGKGAAREPTGSGGGRKNAGRRPAAEVAIAAPGRPLGPKARQRQLAEVEKRLVYALRAAEVGVFDWDVRKGKTIYINPYGDPARPSYNELDDEDSSDLTHPDDRALQRTAVERLLKGETDALDFTERRLLVVRNTWAHVQVRGRVVERDAAGRPARVLGIFRDVTEMVERTRSAHLRELAVANASRLASVGEMAAVLGHELNQPLAALTTYVQALARLVKQRRTTPAEIARALDRCVGLAERASGILLRVRTLVKRSPARRGAVRPARGRDGRRGAAGQAGARSGCVDPPASPRATVPVGPIVCRSSRRRSTSSRNAIEALAGATRARGAVTVAVDTRDGSGRLSVSRQRPGHAGASCCRVLFSPFHTTQAGAALASA